MIRNILSETSVQDSVEFTSTLHRVRCEDAPDGAALGGGGRGARARAGGDAQCGALGFHAGGALRCSLPGAPDHALQPGALQGFGGSKLFRD